MNRIIVTGANGAGKTTFARQLAAARPALSLIHYDALKLTRDWRQRDWAEIDVRLSTALVEDAWILEGGPSLLPYAIQHADALVWLDPPFYARALRLARRPWANLGRTRQELPEGNPDRVIQQYGFALRSLARTKRFRAAIAAALADPGAVQVWHCRTLRDAEAALATLSLTPPSRPP